MSGYEGQSPPGQIGQRSLIEIVEGRTEETLALLRELVKTPSPSPPGNESAVVSVLDDYMGDIPSVSRTVIAKSALRPNVIFSYGEGPTLLLSAHTDTVPPAERGWTYDPYAATIEDGKVYGLGACDNKGAVASMAVAFKLLAESGIELGGRLLFCANADEERGGEFGIRHILETYTEQIDAAVVGEPSGIVESFEKLWTAARGLTCFTVEVEGDSGHSGLASEATRNAITDLMALWQPFSDEVAELPVSHPLFPGALRLNAAMVGGGADFGIVPGIASLSCDLRFPPGITSSSMKDRVAEALKAASAKSEVKASITFQDAPYGGIEPIELDDDEPVLLAAKRAWKQVFGEDPEVGAFPASSDARLFMERGISVLPALGPGTLGCAHSANEWLAVSDLRSATLLYSCLVLAYFDELKSGESAESWGRAE